MLLEILIFFASLVGIAIVSDKIIVYTNEISSYFGLSQMSAGFILLSVTTSMPELFISALASLMNESGLSVGNVLGSNIANLTIILGLAVLISGHKVKIKSGSENELVQFLFLSSLIPLFILQRGSTEPILGLVLLIMFVYFSLNISKKTGKIVPLNFERKKKIRATLIKYTITIGALLLLSKLIVDNGIAIATYISLPPAVIGATIIALGTSLPELATTVQSLKKHYYDMALGNIFGSCITNLTLVLGLSSLLSFSKVSIIAAGSLMFFTLASSLTVWYFVSTSKQLNRRIAFIVIMIYILFALQQIGFSIFIF